jgi:hypothetical protein
MYHPNSNLRREELEDDTTWKFYLVSDARLVVTTTSKLRREDAEEDDTT